MHLLNTMAYARTTITEAELAFFYGAGVNAGVTADASEFFVETTEAYLCTLLKYDFVTNWAALNDIYKILFTEYLGRMAAVSAISYNMAGYTDGIEAENMIKIHWQRALDIQELLNKADVQDFLKV